MPRNTAVRKLDWLIRKGYITRRGTKYCMTDKVNLSGLEQVMRMQARLCEASVKNLSILDTQS
jgi:DNA-binding IclR family transcriptional regulator